MQKLFLLALGVGLITGCGSRVDLGGYGQVCIVGPDAEFTSSSGISTTVPTSGSAPVLEAGPTEIVVFLDDCHSGSARNETAECAFTSIDGLIEVSSQGGYNLPRFGRTEDCNVLAATCPGPDLTEGSWTLAYGDEVLDFDVPSSRTPCTDWQWPE